MRTLEEQMRMESVDAAQREVTGAEFQDLGDVHA